MRIITGKARGLKLVTPKNYLVRPTADRVKEALFNIIQSRIPGSTVLDAFAGTGNLGLEAWSRGAEEIVYFDKSRESLKLVKANVEKARAGEQVTLIHTDAVNGLAMMAQQGKAFDVIFSDPPYDKGLNRKVVEALEKWPVLKEGGLLVLEHSLEENPADYLPQGTEFRQEKYGDTKISLIVWKS
ncbi:16S rRNA (guanine(966)-N(2))-methyltransferase RsmD [uncultured Acidaminococcus sp.]|uniref:16S rRNA (guanine(966)-N(2))-methyltransferase RsmD n=1 Tax=uncultured Acidaminococcus sp. TaxID=352152 RepID=UPI00265D6BC8|nr:16S rRNA (guanine(966)-N(2))-methyltransferase RsmD [uncultured Acidaminococcus sp.]